MAKTQWHPAFCAAMRLELKGNPTLQFTDEFHLTEKPLEVDLLIINKPSDVRIDNMIGEFFGEHNVLEYKSPTDHDFNGFAVAQALSYAYYYCDRYQTWDVTVSLVVSREHFNLLKWLDAQGMKYIKRHDGIYTLCGISLLNMQIIVTEELDGENFRWLSALTDRLTETKAKEFVGAAHNLTENEDRRLAESIIQVVTSANEGVFEKMKEDGIMASALFELMRPEIEKYAQEYAQEHAQEYAQKFMKEKDLKYIKAMIRHGNDNAYIKSILDVTDEEIDKLREAVQQVSDDGIMSSALFKLMRPEIEKYAQEFVKEKYLECAQAMIRHGDDNAYIKSVLGVTDEEIDKLRETVN